MPAGVPQVEITYDIDANGILHVTAKEKSTSKEASITIQNTTTLSEDEVERMVQDAAAHSEEDRQAREYAEAKNTLDSLRAGARKLVEDSSSAPDDVKQPVIQAADDAENAVNSNAPKERLEELQRTLTERMQALQSASQARPGGHGHWL